MKTRDIAVNIDTSAYQRVSDLIAADTDHDDVGVKWRNVTITAGSVNGMQVKNSKKDLSASVGSGRFIAAGDSFNYLEVDARELWIIGDSGSSTIIISFNQEGAD